MKSACNNFDDVREIWVLTSDWSTLDGTISFSDELTHEEIVHVTSGTDDTNFENCIALAEKKHNPENDVNCVMFDINLGVIFDPDPNDYS